MELLLRSTDELLARGSAELKDDVERVKEVRVRWRETILAWERRFAAEHEGAAPNRADKAPIARWYTLYKQVISALPLRDRF